MEIIKRNNSISSYQYYKHTITASDQNLNHPLNSLRDAPHLAPLLYPPPHRKRVGLWPTAIRKIAFPGRESVLLRGSRKIPVLLLHGIVQENMRPFVGLKHGRIVVMGHQRVKRS